MDGIVLYRNRELVPSPVRTVSEWIERAETPIDGVMIESALNLSFLHAGAQAHACGGSILEVQLSPAFDGPLGICWLRFIQRLGDTGNVSLASDEALNDFLNGRAGWYFGSSERIEFLENELGADTVVVDPWPIYSVTGSRMAGYVWTENAFFSSEASSNDLAAAWAFVGSLLEVEDQLYFSEVGHGSLQPVRIGVEPVDPRMAEVRVVLEGGMALPFLDGKEALIEVLERAVRAVTVLGTDPELALERALLELDELEAED
jgi:ABC-type glycerol-3-phosphate transport system substrate-binding protein